MRSLLISLLAVFALTACNPTEPDLGAWLAEGVIVDTRTKLEYSAGHIAGSVLLPHDSIDQTIASVAPDKTTPIILYCRSGNRAGIAKRVLNDMGYENVVNLGGLQEAKTAIMDAQKPE